MCKTLKIKNGTNEEILRKKEVLNKQEINMGLKKSSMTIISNDVVILSISKEKVKEIYQVKIATFA